MRIEVILTISAWLCLPLAAAEEPSPPFTIVLLPDTQYYSLKDPPVYKAQTQWIVDNQTRENIEFVIHLGDITNNNTPAEWIVAHDAHLLLDNAQIPYTVVPGNHDYPDAGHVRDTSEYNKFFGPRRFQTKPWYGGHYGTTNDSSYAFFEARGLQFMVVNLEFAPRKDVLCWADDLISRYPQRRVIVVTHCYLGHGGRYQTDCACAYGIEGSGGDTIWRELVSRHSNIFMVLSGHIGDSELSTRIGNAGNTVYEILTDYQAEQRYVNGLDKTAKLEDHGNGWMRTLTFDPSANTIAVKTFTVLRNVTALTRTADYPSDPADPCHSYTLDYDMKALLPYNYVRSTNSFNDRTVNKSSHRNQRRPSIAMASSGDFVVAWEDDSDGAADIYQIHARGFCAHGCESFDEITVNADYRGQQRKPSIAMTPDGLFVIAWEDDTDENGVYQIRAAGFDAHGLERFGDITVNENAPGQQLKPSVAVAPGGSFVVAWEDDTDENCKYEICAAGFDAAGQRKFGDITVNGESRGQQLKPSVAVDSNSSFVVVWQDDRNENGKYQIRAAGFDSQGRRKFGDTTVNEDADGQQLNPHIAMTLDGSFVVAWEDDADENGKYQIYAAGFDASGVKRFGDITVNEDPAGQQLSPSVAAAPDGSFVVAWEDDNDENQSFQILAAGFNSKGQRRFSDITINENPAGQQRAPDVAIDPHGNFVVTWQDDLDQNGYYQILARGLDRESRQDCPVSEASAQILTSVPAP